MHWTESHVIQGAANPVEGDCDFNFSFPATAWFKPQMPTITMQ
jgi:hypothetical protein